MRPVRSALSVVAVTGLARCRSQPVPGPARVPACLAREPQPVVPVPWTRRCLTVQAVGGSLAGPPSNSCLEGMALVSPSRIPRGLEWSWQTAWDLWKGLDGAQSVRLESWTPLVWEVGWRSSGLLWGGSVTAPTQRAP